MMVYSYETCSGGSRGVSIVSMEPPLLINIILNIAYKLNVCITAKLYLFFDMLIFMLAPDPPLASVDLLNMKC